MVTEMSTRSKIWFGISVATALTVIPWVHYVQEEQRVTLRAGPKRDAQRYNKKLNAAQEERKLEYEDQKRRRDEYSRDQTVSDRG